MDPRKPLGKHRVVHVRDDQKAIDLSAWVTGITADDVRARFEKVHGRTLVQTALEDLWPWTASTLGNKTAAIAREAGLHGEIKWVTGGSKHLVTRRLNSSGGNRLIKNLFWDLWPSEDAAPPATPPTAEAEDDDDDGATSANTRPIDEKHDTDPPPAGFQPDALVSSRYDVKHEIGRGGFGTTWLAHDRLSGLDLVLKVPHADDGGAIRHELELAFQIVHPNICQAFPDRDDETGQPFLVMQHGGADLRALLERGGWKPFPLPLALHVLTSIAEALDYLHSKLVLHLDVSPMNILIDDDDVVRLTDFGASSRARTMPTTLGSHTVQAHEITSLHGLWSAPELFRGVGRSRSDQYSLFLVFATLLSGQIPRSPGDFPKPPFDILSDAQNDAIAKALSADPDARFETCGEAARAVSDGVGRVPERVLAKDIEGFARDLRSRLRREHARPSGTHTTKVGGVVKLGGGVERLLLAMYLWIASKEGIDPAVEIRRINRGLSIHRAPFGVLSTLLRERAHCAAAKRPEVSRIIADLDSYPSRIHRLMTLRNDVAHQGVLGEGLEDASAKVASLLDDYLAELAGASSQNIPSAQ